MIANQNETQSEKMSRKLQHNHQQIVEEKRWLTREQQVAKCSKYKMHSLKYLALNSIAVLLVAICGSTLAQLTHNEQNYQARQQQLIDNKLNLAPVIQLNNEASSIRSNSSDPPIHMPKYASSSSKKGASAWQNQNLGKLMKYLSEHQQELVKANPGSILAVARGIKLAIHECQYQLRNEPWDCPIQGFSIRPTEVFGMLMSRNFKETSFVQALLSSAIAHAVARACTEGQITTCSRKKDPHDNDFAEDIDFGRQFAKRFMDVTHELQLYQAKQQQQQQQLQTSGDQRRRRATIGNSLQPADFDSQQEVQLKSSAGKQVAVAAPMWKERRLRYMISAHNDDVGLLTVYNGMMKECKCHGLSGACTMQTCWKRLPKFRDVANKLRDSFDQALRVEMYSAPQGSNSLAMMNRHKSLTSATTINGKLNKKRSSYSHQSPPLLVENNNNKPFGRSLAASKRVSGTIQPAAPLTSSSSSTSTTTTSAAMAASSMDDISNNGIGASRLQQAAYQQDAPAAISPTQVQDNSIMTDLENNQQRQVADRELGAYNSHQQVFTTTNSTASTFRRRPIARSIGPTASMMLPSKGDLLYAEESPDFCVPNPRYNIKGTKGRICSENPNASNNCEKLCCGRGYKTEIREVGYACNCNFKFCCDLHCQVCKRPKIEHKCL